MSLHKYIRHLVICFSFFFSIIVFFIIKRDYGIGDLGYIRLAQVYGLTSLSFLYLTLLASPLYSVFPKLLYRGIYIKGRKALGISAFYFASLHFFFAFFKLLGGFAGLSFLPQKHLIAVIFGSTSLFILALMAITSFNYFVAKLGKNWKRLHRLVYLAEILIILHILTLGSHFSNLSKTIPMVFFILTTILLLLEALKFDNFIKTKHQSYRAITGIISALIIFIFVLYFLSNNQALSTHH